MRFVRSVYFSIGILCLTVGFVGVFLPLLPTTPFVLLAAWCFSKSSKTLHNWLLANRYFGRIILDWQKEGAIQLRVKCLASIMLVLTMSYPLLSLDFWFPLKIMAALSAVLVLVFLWSRPEPKQPVHSSKKNLMRTAVDSGL